MFETLKGSVHLLQLRSQVFWLSVSKGLVSKKPYVQGAVSLLKLWVSNWLLAYQVVDFFLISYLRKGEAKSVFPLDKR